MTYTPRVADRLLEELLSALGATLIEGPRGCGKTTTALQQARSSTRLDRSPELVALAALNPQALLSGAVPRLVDEWQLAPSLWNVIRHEIDDRRTPGQFILSGSATPHDDIARHSGAGRFARMRMRPMALAETFRLSDGISLSGLGPGDKVRGVSELTYPELAERAVIGGWPALLSATSTRAAVTFNRSYIDDLCGTEIPAATGTRHDPARLRRLLSSIARNVSAEVTLRSLAADASADGGDLGPKTVATYLDSLRTVFALDELPAWSVALRSKSRLRTAPKLHFADPALACAALGVGPDRLAQDPEYFGQVFESMVVRDLRVLVTPKLGRVYHYRDNTGLEIDAVIEFPDGKWGAVEVKLGSAHIADAERHLLALRDERVDTDRLGAPAFLAVVTGTQYAYTLPTGVHVIPLGLLKP